MNKALESRARLAGSVGLHMQCCRNFFVTQVHAIGSQLITDLFDLRMKS